VPNTLVEHRRQRDWPSYLALAMLFLLWVRPSARGPGRSQSVRGELPPTNPKPEV
jgi:hypothetical protein